MPVSDEQVAALRAHLAGDFALHERLWAGLDREDIRTGYSALIIGAFFKAVNIRFSTDNKVSDIVEFVGDVRSRSAELAEEIDPRIAERLILFSLGHGEVDDIDGNTRVTTSLYLLTAIIAGMNLDDAGLDAFLAEARKLGDQLMDD